MRKSSRTLSNVFCERFLILFLFLGSSSWHQSSDLRNPCFGSRTLLLCLQAIKVTQDRNQLWTRILKGFFFRILATPLNSVAHKITAELSAIKAEKDCAKTYVTQFDLRKKGERRQIAVVVLLPPFLLRPTRRRRRLSGIVNFPV